MATGPPVSRQSANHRLVKVVGSSYLDQSFPGSRAMASRRYRGGIIADNTASRVIEWVLDSFLISNEKIGGVRHEAPLIHSALDPVGASRRGVVPLYCRRRL